jgi:hypothetical protein
MDYGATVGYVNILETTTDGDGWFRFPAWGPRIVANGKVRLGAPILLIYKENFQFLMLANNGPSGTNAPSSLQSDWNDRSMPMKRLLRESQKENLRSLEILAIANLEQNGRLNDVRRLLCALARQSTVLAANGIPDAFPSADWLRMHELSC